MVNYFNYFPKTVYEITDEPSLDIAVNLTTNYSIYIDSVDNSAIYYEYTIADYDSIETVSYKVYGEPGYHWVIMRLNNINDIKTDWPLDNKSLMLSIESKYSTEEYADTANTDVTGIQWAMANYKSFYKVETQQLSGSGLSLDPLTEKIEIDSNTYNTLSSSSSTFSLDTGVTIKIDVSKDRLTYFDYEINLNEQKRNIKVLKPEFIPSIKEEFTRIMRS